MGEYFDQIPEELRSHIKEITKTSGLPDTEESLEKISQAWLEKKKAFEEKIASFNMEEVELLSKEDERGALALTYSGSLVTIGPLIEGKRKAVYVSIGLRHDVPETAEKEGSALKKDVAVDETIEFEPGPVKHTSPILKIAIPPADLSAEEQQERITEATQVIQEEFVEVNKTIVPDA